MTTDWIRYFVFSVSKSNFSSFFANLTMKLRLFTVATCKQFYSEAAAPGSKKKGRRIRSKYGLSADVEVAETILGTSNKPKIECTDGQNRITGVTWTGKSSMFEEIMEKTGVYGRSSLETSNKPKTRWTDEQKRVLEAVSNRKSIFITGSAGTGKTFLLKEIIKTLREIHGESVVYVTASTGIAACALGGQTLHSFAGVGFGEMDRERLLDRVLEDTRAWKRWREAKALVIDETSMIGAELFDNLAYIARSLRDDGDSVHGNKAWAGIQLVVSADFFQLPPVVVEKFGRRRGKKKGDEKVYAFEAECWSSSFDMQIELTKVFRQSEWVLVHLLQRIRKGNTDPNDLKLLMDRCSIDDPDPSAVRLFPRTEDVDKLNKKKMEELNEKIHVYKAHDSGKYKWLKQLRNGIARERLEICVGARVMLIKNIDTASKLVNGTTGTVLRFVKGSGNVLPVVRFDSGIEMDVEREQWVVKDGDRVVASRRQIPLILSWALSIHKCQGMSLDKLHTDLSRVFGCGMVYVALSRARSFAGLHLSGLEPSMIVAHPKVVEFYRGFSKENHEKREGQFDEEC